MGRPASVLRPKTLATITKSRNPIHHRRAEPQQRRLQPKGFDCVYGLIVWLTKPGFASDRTSSILINAIEVVASRSSAFEHPGRPIAAHAHGSKWHIAAIRP